MSVLSLFDKNLCDTRYEQLLKFRDILRKSAMVTQILNLIRCDTSFSAIRCLALGSPTGSHSALFQLALLVELEVKLDVKCVSVYDPVFSNADRELFERLHYQVQKTFEGAAPECLFFLPHADLELTEEILLHQHPSWFLANNVSHHTERMLRHQLHEKFPTISLLLERIERSSRTEENSKAEVSDVKAGISPEKPQELVGGFIAAPARRKRGRKQNLYIPQPIDFDFQDCYHESASVFPLDDGGSKQEWDNAFSSLALHIIKPKRDKERAKKPNDASLMIENLSNSLKANLSLDSE